jgi:hypothetical protein
MPITESIEQYIRRLATAADTVEFEQTMALIGHYYDYTPTALRNGIGADAVLNAAGSNEGSCRIFAFAQLNGLTPALTLACFGRFYRDDVLGNPGGSDHANIRSFMRHGWAGIAFEGVALAPKPGL